MIEVERILRNKRTLAPEQGGSSGGERDGDGSDARAVRLRVAAYFALRDEYALRGEQGVAELLAYVKHGVPEDVQRAIHRTINERLGGGRQGGR